MRKKNRKKTVAAMGATTTAKDWGFGPVAGKGGQTRNSGIGEGMIHRELKAVLRAANQKS